MAVKKDVFFVNNINFQLLMALLVAQMLGLRRENTLLHINSRFSDERSTRAIEKYFTLTDRFDEEYETAYFFTTVFPVHDVFIELKCKKKILVYEGLTTYYTEYWASLFNNWSVDDFDEILVPDTELVVNPSAAKYIKLDCVSWFANPCNLELFVKTANDIFMYRPELNDIEYKHKVVLFDRHFEHFVPHIFKHTAHRITTIFCAAAFQNNVLVKLHPGERQNYFFNCFGFQTIMNRIPNELIFANMLYQNEMNCDTERIYIIYNSSAAVNCYSFFGDIKFKIICIGELLNRYGDGVEGSLASVLHTKKVLMKLNEISEISIYFPENIEDIFRIAQKII